MLRSPIKNLLAGLLYGSGLLSLLIRWRFRNRAVVLTYHRVLPGESLRETFSHEAIIVSPQAFGRHLAALKRHFRILDPTEFVTRLRSHDFTRQPSCLITFDDAWSDNHTHAFPILRRHSAPAVIFVPTDYIGTGMLFWQERLGHLVKAVCRDLPERAGEILRPYGWDYLAELSSAEQIDEIKSIIRDIKNKAYPEIDALIADLEAVLGDARPDYGLDSYLSVAQMREMQQGGVSFQSHGCSHRILTRLSPQEVRHEMDASRRWLEEHLDTRPIAHAYPNGDHDTAVAECCTQTGYHAAFTTVYGDVMPDSDPYTIRRINVNENAAPNEARLLLNLYLSG